ncbi:MAG: hypothetical protein AB1298_06980, partial [Bacteroidota bacterium]
MKRLVPLWAILALEIINAQSFFYLTTFKNTSLDVTTDVSSIALGESFVANRGSPFSFFENPAALPINEVASIFYSSRSFGWSKPTENFSYFSIGTTVNSPIGKFGFAYKNFSTGSFSVLQADGNQTINDINKTFILSYAGNIFNGL